MHLLHEYLASQLATKLRKSTVVVWYDEHQEFADFVSELRNGGAGLTQEILLDGFQVTLAEYAGSMLELRMAVESIFRVDEPAPILLYVPDHAQADQASLLMEIAKAGDTYVRTLKWVARQVLRQRFTDGTIDNFLERDRLSYADVVAAVTGDLAVAPSTLKTIYPNQAGTDLILDWLSDTSRDVAIAEKQANAELASLLKFRLGQEFEAQDLALLRSDVLRYVLAGEFRSDLNCQPPASLDRIPQPATKDFEGAVRDIARRLRDDKPDAYEALADEVEAALNLGAMAIDASALGSIDTFRFEERALLTYCGILIAEGQYAEALKHVKHRADSFWLDRDLERKSQWEAVRAMAELGALTERVGREIEELARKPAADWVAAYTARDEGWHELDAAQRRLEGWISKLMDEPDDLPLQKVRRAYDDVCHRMASAFTRAFANSNWSVSTVPHQTRTYADVVAARPKPVVYFLVDAMRYEMGLDLARRLPTSAEVDVRPAIGALPTITPIGMAALQPMAASSFSVTEEGGKLGVRVDGSFLPDLTARRKFAAARVPELTDTSLDELLRLSSAKLTEKLKGVKVLVVRSQEIDLGGELGMGRQARRIMDDVINDLATAIRKLSRAGVEHSVVAADHGHMFFFQDRDESMRIDPPGGQTVDLHRRCWIGRGGATPTGCVRVTASSLGYDSDLDFIFPIGIGVFRAGGDLAYYHGGVSLQELIVPVMTVLLRSRDTGKLSANRVALGGIPNAITNRIFSVTLTGDLASGQQLVRPILVSGPKQVGALGMAVGAEYDRATGQVSLNPGEVVTVAFQLTDESAKSIHIVVLDPQTDSEIYRSPSVIPVSLGV